MLFHPHNIHKSLSFKLACDVIFPSLRLIDMLAVVKGVAKQGRCAMEGVDAMSGTLLSPGIPRKGESAGEGNTPMSYRGRGAMSAGVGGGAFRFMKVIRRRISSRAFACMRM